MIMGHVGDTAFLPEPKKTYHLVTWVIRPGKKKSLHSEHSAVLPLTPHTISIGKLVRKKNV